MSSIVKETVVVTDTAPSVDGLSDILVADGWRGYRDPFALLAIGGASGLLIYLAWSMLGWWYWEYTKEESYYGHALLVPVFVAIMIWHRRDVLRAVPKRTTYGALALFVPSLLLFVWSQKNDMEAVKSWSFLLTITGGVWFLLGTEFVKKASFPLLFLWLMAPLPGPLLNDATQSMQGASTNGAAWMLKMIGFNPQHEGNLLIMENYTLFVDVPCSGFKLLLRLLTFSAAFAYLTDTTLAKRIGLFLISLPLSLFINSLRIGLIGVVGEAMGGSAAHTFHDWSGLGTTVLCMAILFAIAKGLGCRSFAGQPIF